MMGLFDASNSTMWAAVGAVAQGAASIMAIWALIYSMTTFKKSLASSHYAALDAAYLDLLRAVVDHPHLNHASSTRTDDEKIQYDAYAFMVWNFIETIHDHCKDNTHLGLTWYPVIHAENSNHRKWFEDGENRKKFKASFREFVDRQLPPHEPAVTVPLK